MKFIIFKQIFHKSVVFWIICTRLFCNANNFRVFFFTLCVRVPKMRRRRRREKITKSICFTFLSDNSGYKILSNFPLFAFELAPVNIWTSRRRKEKNKYWFDFVILFGLKHFNLSGVCVRTFVCLFSLSDSPEKFGFSTTFHLLFSFSISRYFHFITI